MTLKYDLHSHSTASDGTLSPTRLVHRAAEAGVDVLALTDHDTTEGISEALNAAENHPVQVVSGIEISVTWNNQVVHIVGLGIDIHNEVLQRGLVSLREFRDRRAVEIGKRLAKVGIEDAYEGAKALSNGRLISRTHFARFLIEKGYVSETKKVFKKYLTRGKPGYVPGQWAELADAVAWIVAAGGQAVIAHPARYGYSRTKLRRLIGEFVDAGGEGIEVGSGSHSRDDIFTMARHAQDFELKGSVGSDYHGPETPWRELGHVGSLPSGVTPIWNDWDLSAERLSA